MAGKKKLAHWHQITIDSFMTIRRHPDFDEDIERLLTLLRHPESMKELTADLEHIVNPSLGSSRSLLFDQNLKRMMQKYEAPRGFYELLKHYTTLLIELEEDGQNINEIHEESLTDYLISAISMPPIFLVSLVDNTVLLSDDSPLNFDVYREYVSNKGDKRVFLELTPDVQKQDLIDYIDGHYKQIESKLELLDVQRLKRSKSRQQLSRDYRIISLYKTYMADNSYKGAVYAKIHESMNQGLNKESCTLDTIQKVIKHYRRQKRDWDILLP